MGGIQLVTDSACDLPDELTESLGIKVVPLSIRFGPEELVDRVELSPKEFWDRVVTGPYIPQTAAPSPGAFQTVFEEAAAEGKDGIICINLSSKVSGTFQSAKTAADALSDRIRTEVVDSLTLTLGLGLVVLEAVELLASGASMDDVVSGVKDAASRTKVFGLIDSLEFLRKGGRIGGASQLFGSVLSIKPILEVKDGVVEVNSKQRTRTKGISYLDSLAKEAGPLKRIALANGDSPDIEEIADMLRKVRSEHPLELSTLGPVVGSHTGPASMGVCFMLERK
ncbi:MAG: DegV family protein [Acidimicrobiales bacterium]